MENKLPSLKPAGSLGFTHIKFECGSLNISSALLVMTGIDASVHGRIVRNFDTQNNGIQLFLSFRHYFLVLASEAVGLAPSASDSCVRSEEIETG